LGGEGGRIEGRFPFSLGKTIFRKKKEKVGMLGDFFHSKKTKRRRAPRGEGGGEFSPVH